MGRQLEPGGWLEVQDHCYPLRSDDDTIKGTKILEWSMFVAEAAEQTGRSVTVAPIFKSMMEEAGFTDIVVKSFKLPTNSWPKDPGYKKLGALTFHANMEGLDGISLQLFTEVLGWTAEDVRVYLVDVRKNLKSRNIHGYWPA